MIFTRSLHYIDCFRVVKGCPWVNAFNAKGFILLEEVFTLLWGNLHRFLAFNYKFLFFLGSFLFFYRALFFFRLRLELRVHNFINI